MLKTDTTSVNNRKHSGEESQRGEPELPRAPVPRKSQAKDSTGIVQHSVCTTEASPSFLFLLPLLLDAGRAPSAPGVCLEEAEGVGGKDRSVWFLPDHVAPLLFSSFQIREVPPQPKAGPCTQLPLPLLCPLGLLR